MSSTVHATRAETLQALVAKTNRSARAAATRRREKGRRVAPRAAKPKKGGAAAAKPKKGGAAAAKPKKGGTAVETKAEPAVETKAEPAVETKDAVAKPSVEMTAEESGDDASCPFSYFELAHAVALIVANELEQKHSEVYNSQNRDSLVHTICMQCNKMLLSYSDDSALIQVCQQITENNRTFFPDLFKLKGMHDLTSENIESIIIYSPNEK